MHRFLLLPQALIVLISIIINPVFGQSTKENFTPYETDTVQLLAGKTTLGDFDYTILNNGEVTDESSLLCQFDGDGSLLIGFKSKVTEVRISSSAKGSINVQGFRASLINSFNNESVFYKVKGFREGQSVTLDETVEVNTVKLPGTYVNLTHLPGFNEIDELRIYGDNVKITLEEFVYRKGNKETDVTASN